MLELILYRYLWICTNWILRYTKEYISHTSRSILRAINHYRWDHRGLAFWQINLLRSLFARISLSISLSLSRAIIIHSTIPPTCGDSRRAIRIHTALQTRANRAEHHRRQRRRRSGTIDGIYPSAYFRVPRMKGTRNVHGGSFPAYLVLVIYVYSSPNRWKVKVVFFLPLVDPPQTLCVCGNGRISPRAVKRLARATAEFHCAISSTS